MITAALAHHLSDLGIVTFGVAGTDCFLEDLPAQPEGAVGLFAQAGPPPRPYVGMRRPYIQVLVRGDGSNGRSQTGYDRAMAIQQALDDTAHIVWGVGTEHEVRVAWCLAMQSEPVNIGPDDNNQPRWSVRFEVETDMKVAA